MSGQTVIEPLRARQIPAWSGVPALPRAASLYPSIFPGSAHNIICTLSAISNCVPVPIRKNAISIGISEGTVPFVFHTVVGDEESVEAKGRTTVQRTGALVIKAGPDDTPVPLHLLLRYVLGFADIPQSGVNVYASRFWQLLRIERR